MYSDAIHRHIRPFYPISNHSSPHKHTHRNESVGYFMFRKLLRDIDFFSQLNLLILLCVHLRLDCYNLDVSMLYCYTESVMVITTKLYSKREFCREKIGKKSWLCVALYYF